MWPTLLFYPSLVSLARRLRYRTLRSEKDGGLSELRNSSEAFSVCTVLKGVCGRQVKPWTFYSFVFIAKKKVIPIAS